MATGKPNSSLLCRSASKSGERIVTKAIDEDDTALVTSHPGGRLM
ncbi:MULTISPECIES: hypothetical protein [Asaia]